MKRLKLVFILIFIFLTFTGCLAKTELEDFAYVIAIGIDKGSEDNYMVTFQIAVPIKIAGEGSTGGGKESTSLVTLETDTLFNSISRADSMISKEITLSHNKMIVLSEEVAKEGVQVILNALVTNREIRPKTSIIVYRGKAKELLTNLEPILEKNPARYYDLLLDSNQYTGYAIDNTLFNFYLSSKDTLASPYALLTEPVKEEESSIEIPSRSKENPDSTPQKRDTDSGDSNNNNSNFQINNTQEENNTSQTGSKQINQSTGGSQNSQTPQNNNTDNSKSKTPKTANIAGVAIFANDKLVGEIKNEQILSHVMLLGKLQKVNIDIEDIKDPNKTTVIKVRQIEAPKINVNITNNKPFIDIVIRLECDLITSGSQIDYTQEENKHKLSNAIKSKLSKDMEIYLNKISKDFKADPIGFGKHYRIKVATIDELEQIEWQKIFPNSEFNFNFQIHLDTTQMVSNQVS